jgi:hypothetical protein
MREEIVQANRWPVSSGCRYRANQAVSRMTTTMAATTLVGTRMRSSCWLAVPSARGFALIYPLRPGPRQSGNGATTCANEASLERPPGQSPP